jgi:NADPH:quinone reductase
MYMRRVRYYAHGGPEVLTVEEAPVPEPGPGQVLIRTEAVGLNYLDALLRRETDRDSVYYRDLPASLTGDVVGTVTRAGQGADPALVGSRVAVLLEDACAEYVITDTSWLVSVPAALDAGAASVLPTMGAVALGALHTGRIAPDETVLVTAAAGGIGHLAVQLARQMGAGTIIGAVGSTSKSGFLKELGVDIVAEYTQANWGDQVRRAAPRGVDVVLDAVGGGTLLECIELLAPFGRVVAYGAADGNWGSVPVLSLAALKTLSAFSLLAWRAAAPERARADIAKLTSLLQCGELRAVTTAVPLAEVASAHRQFEDRSVLGRLVLTV